ncbi:MAG: hypothetical protein HWN65_05920 [Candidatus Helarchaeota archaeon]|nr:hypothetical protein [Candidatus Helarchaeota archaeon]
MNRVCVVKSGYQISYDKSLLHNFNFKNLRINLRYLLCGPPRSRGEGLFFRIILGDKGKCIQCIFFYKTQWIPYHPHDYHPFYIYLDDVNDVSSLIIDDGHHFSKLRAVQKGVKRTSIDLTIFLPDHGMTDQIKGISKIFQPKLIPLLPDQIERWWLINNMAQLKLRTKLIDPWAPGLIPDTPSKKVSLLYRLNQLLPFKIPSPIKNNIKFTFRDESACPICHSLETLDFIPLVRSKTTGNYILRKKMTCKNNHEYSIRYDFEKGMIELD